MKFQITEVNKLRKRKFLIQRRGAATFHPIINTNDLLGNDILYGECHAFNQFNSLVTNSY
jgi:hypothetical protein